MYRLYCVWCLPAGEIAMACTVLWAGLLLATPVARLSERAPEPKLVLHRVRGGELAEGVNLLVTEEELDVALEEAGSALVVVDYYAEWCGPCKKLAPTLNELARKAKSDKVQFYKVDVDQSRELAAAQGVKSMPTIDFYRHGEKVHQIVGGDARALREIVAKASMSPIIAFLRSEKVLAVLAGLYLVMPWQRLGAFA